jgi:hypothetical protein
MADQTIFEQLAPYAKMTVVKDVTVGRLNYANTQDLYSDAVFTLSTKTVAANTELQFFTAAQSEVGQGFSGPLTLNQTNSKFSKGQPPANQVYIATHLGFTAWKTNTPGGAASTGLDPSVEQAVTLLSSRDLFALIQNFSWDLQIGRGIQRTIGSLLEYPSAGGAWASLEATAATSAAQNGDPSAWISKLSIPIIFPPLVNVGLTAKCGNSFTLLDVDDNSVIEVRTTLRGFLMTMPVGG